jgi:hypothetical protein
MKIRVALFFILTFCMIVALPARAGVIYNNGPINGTVDAWTINFGFVVSDTVTVSGGNSNINGLAFGGWLSPGDTVLSAEVSFTSQPDGGTSYFDQVVNFTQSGCSANQFGFDVCTETGSFHGPNLSNGSYWLNLQNAVDTAGNPVYWDENSGVGCTSPGCPSQGDNGSIGTIPSESFTVYGSPSAVPEPGSIMLFGSGMLGLIGVLRRRRNV